VLGIRQVFTFLCQASNPTGLCRRLASQRPGQLDITGQSAAGLRQRDPASGLCQAS